MSWQPMKTAPKDGTEFLAWFPKVKLDEDDNLTDEVIGGAQAIISFTAGSWNEPEWLNAHGSYFFEDWCFAEDPVLWHPLPPEPVGPIGGEDKWAMLARTGHLSNEVADAAREAAAGVAPAGTFHACGKVSNGIACMQPVGSRCADCSHGVTRLDAQSFGEQSPMDKEPS